MRIWSSAGVRRVIAVAEADGPSQAGKELRRAGRRVELVQKWKDCGSLQTVTSDKICRKMVTSDLVRIKYSGIVGA